MQQYEKLKSKRRLHLILSYSLMTLAVIAISTICILLVLGYRFDGKVERGSLLQFESFPSGASIDLDGRQLGFQTPGKRDVSAGAHEVTLSRNGYRSWSKRFDTTAGEVRWLNYARLVPTTVNTTSVKEFPSLASQLPSPDRRWIALVAKPDTPTLTFADLRDNKKIEFVDISIPAEALTLPAGSTHSFKVVEWNFGASFVLVRHDFTGGHEFIRVSRSDPKNIVNISTKFGLTLSDLHFSNDNVLYGVENGNLRRIDVGGSSLSEPIAKNVVDFKLYGDRDLVILRHEENRFYVSSSIGGNEPKAVTNYDDTLPVLIDLTKYFNEYYVAIARGASFELIKNPEKTDGAGLRKIITLTYPGEMKWLDVSATGRLVIAGSGTQFMTYDIELARRSDVSFPGVLDDTTRPPQWLDSFLLVSTADNKLRISDFDGENQQIIVDTLPAQPVTLSPDQTLLYSFSKTQTGAISLQASKMTVTN